ncbi:MAG: VWA domain-containing protein [Anaerolineales bacterium]
MSFSFIYPRYLWLMLLIPALVGISIYGPRRLAKTRFWASLIFRVVVLLVIIFAIAGCQVHLRTDTLTTIFLLDASDSIPTKEKEYGENLIRLAVQQMPKGDKAAIIVFGKDALVELLASEQSTISDLESVPITTQTNIADALQLAMALYPNEGAKRAILLSDGQENLGTAIEQAELFATANIELLYYPLNDQPEGIEVFVESLNAPGNIRQGEQLQLNLVISSSAAVRALVEVFEDGTIIENKEINLSKGKNQYAFSISEKEPGFHRYRAKVTPETDSLLQNNEASAFVVISGPPKILIIEGSNNEGQNLAAALIASNMLVTVASPSGLPTSLAELSSYEATIFVNTPSSLLHSGAMNLIQSYVRDLGKGFIMVGGENTFGAGGYLRTPIEETLPVNMDVRSKELSANLALVLAIDKSGSMGRCHCDDPDLTQTYTRQEVGQPKVDIAKEAVMKASSALGPEDFLGVVAFDESAKWAIEAGKLSSSSSIERAIGGIIAGGQTNIWAGVEAAYKSLDNIDAKRKHIILLTDGWTNSGDLTPLVEELADKGITLSIIAAGGGSAEYLEKLSEVGKGRYYPAEDILRVPDIFLKETVQSVGEYIIEEPFFPIPESPGPSLLGIDTFSLPGILGYNGTTPKTAARLDLISPKGDPLLATWQYGLGRSAAWTSDLKGKWGTNWIEWENFSKFAGQLVGWVLPEPKSDYIEATAKIENNSGVVTLTVKDDYGNPQNFVQASATIINPSLTSTEIELEQIGSGSYQGKFDISETGSYLIRLGANDENLRSLGQQTLGLVVPYSPEYKVEGINMAKLNELAYPTGGSALGSAQDAFAHNLTSSSYAVEIWRPLLLIATLLFPIDVALRRLILNKQDVSKAISWAGEKIRRKSPVENKETKILEGLFDAKGRAQSRQDTLKETDKTEVSELISNTNQALKPSNKEKDKSIPSDAEYDTLARLREAKKKSKRKND